METGDLSRFKILFNFFNLFNENLNLSKKSDFFRNFSTLEQKLKLMHCKTYHNLLKDKLQS